MSPEEQLYLTDLQARLTENPALLFTKEWSLARQWLYDKGFDQVITNAYQKLPKELKDKIPYKMLPTDVRAGRVQRLTAEAMDKAGKVVYNTAMTATAVPGIITAPVATIGGLALGAAGGYGGSKAGGYIGEKFGGEEGRRKGELYGGLVGGFAGGTIGGYGGNLLGNKLNLNFNYNNFAHANAVENKLFGEQMSFNRRLSLANDRFHRAKANLKSNLTAEELSGLPKGERNQNLNQNAWSSRRSEEVKAIKDFCKKYGYELPEDIDSYSPEQMLLLYKRLLERHNTFFRGVNPIEEYTPEEVLTVIPDFGNRPGSSMGIPPLTAGKHTSTKIPNMNNFEYSGIVRRPLNFNSKNRILWIQRNDPKRWDLNKNAFTDQNIKNIPEYTTEMASLDNSDPAKNAGSVAWWKAVKLQFYPKHPEYNPTGYISGNDEGFVTHLGLPGSKPLEIVKIYGPGETVPKSWNDNMSRILHSWKHGGKLNYLNYIK